MYTVSKESDTKKHMKTSRPALWHMEDHFDPYLPVLLVLGLVFMVVWETVEAVVL